MAKSIKLGSDTYLDAEGISFLLGANLRTVLQRYATSATTYTVNTPRDSNNNYSFGLLFGAPGGETWFCYLLWLRSASIGTDPNVPYFMKIAGGSSAITFTGTYSGSTTSGTLTLTASGTVWGGIRLLWLA